MFTTDSVEVKDKLAFEIRKVTGCCAASSEGTDVSVRDAAALRREKLGSFLDAFLVVH